MVFAACGPTEGDNPDCTTSPYYHDGGSGSSCSDKEVPFNNNFCTTYGSLPTPFGRGTWKEASGCSQKNSDGTYAGTIVPEDGGDAWDCSCVNASGSTASNCGGLEYACSEALFCACSN